MASTHDFTAAGARRRGFTLIELMVATAIMAILVLAVMTITSHVLSTWSSASGRLGANAEARTALQYLGDDLETLVVRPKKQVWLQVKNDATDKLPVTGGNAPVISMITATEYRDRPPSGQPDYGNICAVNYQLAYQHPIVTEAKTGIAPAPVAGLYRKVLSPEDTFNSVLAASNDDGTLNSLPSVVSSDTDTFENFLSSNIADLSVDFYAEDLRTADPDGNPIAKNSVQKVEGSFIYADKLYDLEKKEMPNLGRLVYADIRMTVLSDEGAKALAVASVTEQNAADIIETYGIVFTRRVPILSRY